jgi:hypothetical protein
VPEPPRPVTAGTIGYASPLNIGWTIPVADGVGLDTANWFIRLNNKAPTVLSVSNVSGFTMITFAGGLASPGPDTVSYRPPPYDIATADGTLAPAFEGFPITNF